MRNMLLFFLMLYGAAAWAGDEKPPEISSYIHASAPYGSGAYTWMWAKAYDASLWTDAAHWSMQSSFALSLRYNMHFTAQELAERSIAEMQHIAPLSVNDATQLETRLKTLFPEVRKNDVVTALYLPGKGARFFYNGKLTGTLADDGMARRFLDIWLSAKTSAPDLRAQLLPH